MYYRRKKRAQGRAALEKMAAQWMAMDTMGNLETNLHLKLCLWPTLGAKRCIQELATITKKPWILILSCEVTNICLSFSLWWIGHKKFWPKPSCRCAVALLILLVFITQMLCLSKAATLLADCFSIKYTVWCNKRFTIVTEDPRIWGAKCHDLFPSK